MLQRHQHRWSPAETARERKKRKRWKMEKKGGGIALTPACLFYLGAQHGYGCCAAPSHRAMTASLCSHTLLLPPHTHTSIHTQRLSPLPHPVRPHPLPASLPLIPLLYLGSDFILRHLKHTRFPSTQLCPPPSVSVPPARCVVVLSYVSPAHSLSLPSAAQAQYQFLTFYKYDPQCVLCFLTRFLTWLHSLPPPPAARGDFVIILSVSEGKLQINVFESMDYVLTTECLLQSGWACLYLRVFFCLFFYNEFVQRL